MKRVLIVFNCGFTLNGTVVAIMNYYRFLHKKYKIDFLFYCKKIDNFYGDYVSFVKTNNSEMFVIKKVNFLKDLKLIKKYIYKYNYDIIHINSSCYTFFLGILSLLKRNINVICHFHTNGFSNNFFKKLIENVFFKPYIYIKSNYLLSCSNEAGFVKFGKKYFSKKGIVLKNSIDIDKYKRKINNDDICDKIKNKFILGTVGRLSREKNHILLLELLKILNEKKPGLFYLIIVGNGVEKEKLYSYAEKNNLLESVFFAGEQIDVTNFLSNMDLFLFPSYYEGFGISALEAQANGLFVVCSYGVAREINVCNRCYFMDKNANAMDWANYILSIYNKVDIVDCSDFLRKNGYDIKTNASKLSEIYDG